MPTITDATVVAQPYDTSGNGGRKVVILENDWVVSVAKTTNYFYFYVDKQDGLGFKQMCWIYNTNITSSNDITISSKGNYVFFVFTYSTNAIYYGAINAITVSNSNLSNYGNLDFSQTALGNVSIAINEAKTELHAAWASKNATYPNSFNIRYAKGTINADGTVTWDSVTQVTQGNISGANGFANPSIVVKSNGYPTIISEYNNSTTMNRMVSHTFSGSTWDASNVMYQDNGYIQQFPSAIYVPQSINGLANGLIANAWHGTDSTSGGANYIRFSKSTDGGATWSTAQKLVVGTNASLTANKSGKLFITYEDVGVTKCIESTDNGGNWGSPITVGTGTNPSTLFDLSMQISTPLTIYKGTSSVLFSGSWTISSISPTQGDRGIITNRQSMMTYAITSDGTIGTVTEKINGVTVGTKTLTNGQNTTISITQAQWDNIKYGKYRDINANRNTITIEAQGNTYTYTFDKEPTSSSDIISQTKAVKDSAEVSMPAKKKILSDAINLKGGASSATDSLEVLASKITNSTSTNYKTGQAIASSTTKSFTTSTGSATNVAYISIDFSQIGFSPKHIFIKTTDTSANITSSYWSSTNSYVSGVQYSNVMTDTSRFRSPTTSGITDIPVVTGGVSYTWEAYQ